MSCGVGRRQGSDPALLWLWCRLVAVAPIGTLSFVFNYAAGAALYTVNKHNGLLVCSRRGAVVNESD